MGLRNISSSHTIQHFTPDLQAAFQVNLGETFTMELQDCYGGQVCREEILRTDIDTSIMNQATGPVQIHDLTRNDVCKVEIKQIRLNDTGIMMTSHGLGVLGKEITSASTKLLQVDEQYVHLTDRIKLPITPMIGVIGVATAGENIHTAIPGNHGGNLDTKEITSGHAIYLPVFQDGGMLALGDMHATMGDGELNGTGVEIGGEVTLSVSRLANRNIASPIVETADAFFFLTSAVTLEKAIEHCAKRVTTHLQNQLSLDFQTAYRLLSASCDIRISQVVNKLVTVKMVIPKTVLPTLFLHDESN